MSFKRKLALAVLVPISLFLIAIHTQPVEKAIWAKLVAEAKAFGIELAADRFDLNLFTLSIDIEKLSVRHAAVSLRLDAVRVNARAKVLLGKLDFDEVLLKDGLVQIHPLEPQPDSASSSPPNMPEITLGYAKLEGVRVVAQDQSADLDLALNAVRFMYKEQKLEGGFRSPATLVGGRQLPELTYSLQTRTANFQTFQQLRFSIESGKSTIGVAGEITTGFKPELRMNATLAEDLLPELPGTTLKATVTPTILDISAEAEYLFREESVPIGIATRFDYTAQTIAAPVRLELGSYGRGNLDLRYGGNRLDGTLSLVGEAAALNRILEYGEMTGLRLDGRFAMPDLDPNLLEAEADVAIAGLPQLDLKANYRGGRLEFKGGGAPVPGADLDLEGSYDGRLAVSFQALIPELSDLESFVAVPQDLCGGPVFLKGAIGGEGEEWRVDSLQARVAGLAFEPHFHDDLQLSLEGPLTALEGRVWAETLNPDEAFLDFQLDAVEGVWQSLHVAPVSLSGVYGDFGYRVGLQAQGSGPLTEPSLNGWLEVALDQTGPLALLQAPFHFKGETLSLPNLRLDSGYGRILGKADIRVQPELDWQTELVWHTQKNEGFRIPYEVTLPAFELEISGSRKKMDARLYLPKQLYELWEIPLPIHSDRPLQLSFAPDEARGEGKLPHFQVAGVEFSDLEIRMEAGKVHAQTGFRLRNAETLVESLAAYWPQDLAFDRLNGDIVFTGDIEFEKPEVALTIDTLTGSLRGNGFTLKGLALAYDGRLAVTPFETEFAGVRARFSQADPAEARAINAPGLPPPEPPFDLGLEWGFEVVSPEALKAFIGPDWPEDLTLKRIAGNGRLFSDFLLAEPRLAWQLTGLEAVYQENPITAETVAGFYHQGLWLEPANIAVGDLAVVLKSRPEGFRLEAEPTADDINRWVEGFVGNARFRLVLDVDNSPAGLAYRGTLNQKEGKLVYLDPWVELSAWQLDYELGADGMLYIRKGGGLVNGGAVELSGNLGLDPRNAAAELKLFASGVHLDMVDFQAKVTSALEWQSKAGQHQLSGTVLVDEGYYRPEFGVEGLVEDLLLAVPELYFPDPLLESIKLQLLVLTQNPIIVDSKIGYLELETPSLMIKGNLAEQKPYSGPLNINEGSTLQLGNQVFLFSPSQIQFHPNREDDPYFQLSLQSADYGDKTSFNLTGYLSELDQNLESSDIAGILGTYLLGKVSSLVSLEGEISDTLFDSSFSLVFSKPLTRKVVARYAIPLVDQQQEQRFELTLGPYRNNFLNLIRQEEDLAGNLQHSQRFGFVDNERPLRIKKVVFQQEETPKWVKKKFLLKRDEIFSETRMRRARLDLLGRLRKRGYLSPEMSHLYEDGVLTVSLDFGDHMELIVSGYQFTEQEKGTILNRLRSLDEGGLRHVERIAERLALAKGHPSAAAFAAMENGNLQLEVYVGTLMGDVKFNFGDANGILGEIYKSKAERRELLTLILVSGDSAREKLAARLAAKGYLSPTIGDGHFKSLDQYVMPIQPGPRAIVEEVWINGKPVKSPFLEKKFSFEMIDQIHADLAKSEPSGTLVKVTPRRVGHNIAFDIIRRKTEEPVIDQLDVVGASRISEKKIKRFLGFRDQMRQGRLAKAQQRLIEAGPFRMARLQNTENSAILEVAERNRWDVDYQLSWSENNDLGYGIQFKDRQLFRGFNELAVRVEENNSEEAVLARLRFQRVWGSPVDFLVGLDWNRQKQDPTQFLDVVFGFVDLIHQTPEKRELNLELSYPLTERQRISGGIVYRQNILRRRVETYDLFGPNEDDIFSPENLFDVSESELTTNLVPLRFSWLYRNLDRKIDPANGVLASVGIDHFDDTIGSDGPFKGTRLSAKLTTFKTWGRLLWSQRYEWGWLFGDPPEELRPDNFPDSPLFVLGGSNSVRGFEQDFLGPLAEAPRFEGEERISNVVPLGGQALSFFSHELTYRTNFYGMGISPFLDGGWVWEDENQLYDTSIVVTGGLGLSFDTPVGYFRLDWASVLQDDVFQEVIDGFPLQEDREFIREKGLVEFSFRFGRVF